MGKFVFDKKLILLLQCFISIVFIGYSIVGIIFPACSIQIYQILLLIVFCWSFLSTYFLLSTYYHPYIFFLIAFFIFILGRIPLDIIGYLDFGDNVFFIDSFQFSKATKWLIILQVGLFMLFMHLGFILSEFCNIDKTNKVSWSYNQDLYRCGFFLFWLFLLPALIYWYQFINYVLINGYRALNADSDIISSNMVIRIADDMILLSYFMILASKANLRKITIPTIIYVIILCCTLLTGRRIFFFTQILTILFYFGFRGALSKKILLIICFISACLAVVVGLYRTLSDFSLLNLEGKNLFFDFFADQGISIHAIGLTIDYIDNNQLEHNIQYLFQPLFAAFSDGFGYIDNMLENYFLADQLSNLLMPDVFSRGGGVGSSVVAEFYVVGGYFGIILGALFWGGMLNAGVRLFLKSNVGVLILLMTLPMVLFTPRAFPLLPVVNLLKPLVMFIVIYCGIKLIKIRKHIL